MKFTRTHTETAYITKAGHLALEKFLQLQNRLFNAALEERVDCYRKTGKSLTAYDQMKSLTIVRKEFPKFAEYGGGAMRSCLFRLQRAFENFWRRCKENVTKKGFPRFKSKYRGIKSFDVPVGGFSIRDRTKRWAIHVKGFAPFAPPDIAR